MAPNRSILQTAFRFNPALIALDPEQFRTHCYRSILGRQPEPDLPPIHLAGVKEKAAYWKTFFLSAEYERPQLPLPEKVGLDVRKSLGWDTPSIFFDLAFHFFGNVCDTFEEFLSIIEDSAARFSFEVGPFDTLADSNQFQRALLDGLIDLSIEYCLSAKRVAEIERRLALLERAFSASESNSSRLPGSERRVDPRSEFSIEELDLQVETVVESARD